VTRTFLHWFQAAREQQICDRIGVKDSTSDLLSANCDEFIFYDDLVREQEAQKKRAEKKAPAKAPAGGTTKKSILKTEDDKRQEALDFIVETIEALIAERGEEKIWYSMVKPTMQRRKPGFAESAYGLSFVQRIGGGRAEAQPALDGA